MFYGLKPDAFFCFITIHDEDSLAGLPVQLQKWTTVSQRIPVKGNVLVTFGVLDRFGVLLEKDMRRVTTLLGQTGFTSDRFAVSFAPVKDEQPAVPVPFSAIPASRSSSPRVSRRSRTPPRRGDGGLGKDGPYMRSKKKPAPKKQERKERTRRGAKKNRHKIIIDSPPSSGSDEPALSFPEGSSFEQLARGAKYSVVSDDPVGVCLFFLFFFFVCLALVCSSTRL